MVIFIHCRFFQQLQRASVSCSLFLSSPLSLCGQPLEFLCVVEVSHRKNLTAKQAFSNVLLPYILPAIVISPSLSSRHSLPCSEFLRRACSHPWLPPWSVGLRSPCSVPQPRSSPAFIPRVARSCAVPWCRTRLLPLQPCSSAPVLLCPSYGVLKQSSVHGRPSCAPLLLPCVWSWLDRALVLAPWSAACLLQLA
jgi:hypothetical protein